MYEYQATITERGQMTLPAAVRRLLGVKPGDKVTIVVNGERAELMRRRYTVDDVRGIIPALPGVEPGDFDDLIEEAVEEHAAWVVDRMKRGLE